MTSNYELMNCELSSALYLIRCASSPDITDHLRVLEAPAGLSTRPTSNRLRETLFNVLAPRIHGAAFLDLYSGSGAVGLEALSRGAVHVTFVERAPAALKALRGQPRTVSGSKPGFRIYPLNVAAFLRPASKAGSKSEHYDVVFLDPPYEAAQEYAATLGLLGGDRRVSIGARRARGRRASA